MLLQERLNQMLQPLVEDLGYEFVGLELSGPRHALLRIYIDRADEAGIHVDDCERVSREAAALLDVEDPIKSSYRLEVSSPGLDRPLFKPEHYSQFVGQRIKLALHVPVAGRRRMKGVIQQVSESHIELEHEGEVVRIEFDAIDRARVMPDYDALLKA